MLSHALTVLYTTPAVNDIPRLTTVQTLPTRTIAFYYPDSNLSLTGNREVDFSSFLASFPHVTVEIDDNTVPRFTTIQTMFVGLVPPRSPSTHCYRGTEHPTIWPSL